MFQFHPLYHQAIPGSGDLNGRVQGILSANASDNATYPNTGYYTPAIDIGINTAPDKPLFVVQNITDESGCCATKKLKFYAAGSEYSEVYSREYVSGAWDSWALSVPGTGAQSFTFTGLDQTISHQFYVVAFNADGSSTSDTITTYRCQFAIAISPNPVYPTTTIHVTADQCFLISSVIITNAQTGYIAATLSFDGVAPSVDIDLSPYSLPSGIYVLTAYAPNTVGASNCDEVLTSLAGSCLIQTAY